MKINKNRVSENKNLQFNEYQQQQSLDLLRFGKFAQK